MITSTAPQWGGAPRKEKRKERVMKRLWKRALCMATVLAMMMFFCMTVAAQEATDVAGEEALPDAEGGEETTGENTGEVDYSIEIESGDVTITSNLAGYLAKLEEERLAAEAAAQDAEKMKEELSEEIKNATEAIKGATDEATGAINDALGAFEDGTEWWKTVDGWLEGLENEGAAVIVGVLGILGTIYIGISPILNKVVKSGQQFEKSTATADAVAASAAETKAYMEQKAKEDAERYEKMIAECRSAIDQAKEEAATARAQATAMMDAMRAQYEVVSGYVGQVFEREGALARMITIGFGEDEDLVRRGSAAEIVKIGKEMQNEDGNEA